MKVRKGGHSLVIKWSLHCSQNKATAANRGDGFMVGIYGVLSDEPSLFTPKTLFREVNVHDCTVNVGVEKESCLGVQRYFESIFCFGGGVPVVIIINLGEVLNLISVLEIVLVVAGSQWDGCFRWDFLKVERY